jgi:hypothetical protein
MAFLGAILAAVSLVAADGITLDVPFVAQSESLCGGAAVAMVLRYLGDAHAGARQFAPLIDKRAGGIANDKLIAAVEANGWKTAPAGGSIEALIDQLRAHRPVIILVRDRGSRYHYLVVTGILDDHVLVHDPAWGPSRQLAFADLLRAWQPAHYWGVVILPQEDRRADAPAESEEKAPAASPDVCERLTSQAITDVQSHGFEEADAVFASVRESCPHSAGPVRELAGIRFAQERWAEAAALAKEAIALDDHDRYAWDVLASSRFMLDDAAGSLDAWNHVGRPRIDSVQITGIRRMRYELLARAVGLDPDTLLTGAAFERAARRLADLPDETAARIDYRPAEDGYATVDIAVAERPARPRGIAEWAATAARFLVNREAEVAVPGATGQGELWEASWRWWANRPRLALSLAAPRTGWLPGVLRVEGSWEVQTYAMPGAPQSIDRTRETRMHGGVSLSDWINGDFKYEVNAGIDAWNGNRRTVSLAAGIQRRLLHDRLAIFADGGVWVPVTEGAPFEGAGLRVLFNSSPAGRAWLFTADGGLDVMTDAAPMALWPGAGEGHARPALLRAHRLLDDGVIAGPVFGRTLAHATFETQRWFERGRPIRLGVAAFTDFAQARRTLDGRQSPIEMDTGAGLRVRVPGGGGTIRVDFARGLYDGAQAITVAWQR